jgi:hypothetical protein
MFEERVRHPLVSVAISGLILLVAHLHGSLEVVLPILPLLLLVLSLLSGSYLGCDAIVRLAERVAGSPKRDTARNRPRPPAPRSHAAHGGLLIALGLAKRPPPLAA